MLYRFVGLTLLTLFVVFSVAGCAAHSQAPVTGFVSTNVSAALDVGSGINKPHLKVGTASVTSFLGLFATAMQAFGLLVKMGVFNRFIMLITMLKTP